MVGRWVWRGEEAEVPQDFRDVVAALRVGHAGLVARLLWNHGVHDRESVATFLRPTLAHGLPSPRLLRDVGRAGAWSCGRGGAPLPDLRQDLDLVALGTVAEVVPLREENRVLVAHGLRLLECPTRPGLVALWSSMRR